jgi:hypothetical protein
MICTKALKISLVSALIGLSLSTQAFALTAQVFTDLKHPVDTTGINSEVKVEYYNLGQLQRIVKQMNMAIHGEGRQAAETKAKQIMSEYRSQFNHAADGVKYVHQYKVRRVPTIIFDNGGFRVVGQTNLNTAIEEFKKWESNKK